MFDWRNFDTDRMLKRMCWVGGIATVAVILMRVWLVPTAADWQTGLFDNNYWVMGVMLVALAVLAVLSFLSGPVRREIGGRAGVWVALASILAGLVLAVTGGIDLLRYYGVLPMDMTNGAGSLLSLLEHVFALLGGAALIRFGLALMSEGATRRGIAQWSILAPVMWMWFRLINYEMSYASMVRIEDNFFGFVMLILEMLFLFRLARYASGIGRVSAGSVMWNSMAAALFAVSGPLTRVIMYLLGDNMAYDAYYLAGPVDMAMGVLALAVGIALVSGTPVDQSPASGASDERMEEDEAASVSAESLLFGVEEDAPETAE